MFYELRNSTTAFANEVIENFYHIADGDRLPRSASGNLPEIDNTYDLGSADYKWKTIFCETFYSDFSIPASLVIHKEASVKFTVTASDIEFSGLNGDDNDYLMFAQIGPIPAGSGGVTETCKMVFNGDSSASYNEKYLYYDYASIDMSTSSGNNYINVTLDNAPPNSMYFTAYISGKTGNKRSVKCFTSHNLTPTLTSAYITGTWDNTLDTLTSIKLIKGISLQSEIALWRV